MPAKFVVFVRKEFFEDFLASHAYFLSKDDSARNLLELITSYAAAAVGVRPIASAYFK